MRSTPFTRCCGAICCQSSQEHRGEPPSLFNKEFPMQGQLRFFLVLNCIVKCTGFFYVHYTPSETNGFVFHPKDEAMVKCLAYLNPHAADQKPEFEFSALNHSATTFPLCFYYTRGHLQAYWCGVAEWTRTPASSYGVSDQQTVGSSP